MFHSLREWSVNHSRSEWSTQSPQQPRRLVQRLFVLRAGSLSATMPPPTGNCSHPRPAVNVRIRMFVSIAPSNPIQPEAAAVRPAGGRLQFGDDLHRPHLRRTGHAAAGERRPQQVERRFDLLRAAFPGGSVTGAPKVRAMEIIAELEPTARGPYCGSVGCIGFDGAMDTNILIRTFTAGRGWLQFPVGGGIVADSDPAAEYEETLHKAAGSAAGAART